jgi:hypothetical protein
MTLEIKTADELINPELEGRWALRRAARHTEVLQLILQTFVDQGGPVPVAEVMAGVPGQPPKTVQSALWRMPDRPRALGGPVRPVSPRGGTADRGGVAVPPPREKDVGS